MKKRLLAILAVAVLVIGAPAIAVAARSQDPERSARNQDVIWQGLWAGANFDLSHIEKKKRPAPPAKPATGQPNPPAEPAGYVALGDSVAAGAGLGAGDQCDRSTQAYPYRVAEARGLALNHIACSGATLGDLFTEQHVIGPNPPAQLDSAFASGTPELITITAGANDVQWQRFLRKCYLRTCGTSFDEGAASTFRAALEIKLQVLFRSIENRSHGSPPEVILTGYYNPLSANCSVIEPRLTTAEVAWLSRQLEVLNRVLEAASSRHDYARFVPIDFTGHDVCSSDSWVQTLEDDAPFHPTARGQEAIAEAILSS